MNLDDQHASPLEHTRRFNGRQASTLPATDSIYDVVIVGAGWSGIFALKHCHEKGLTAVVVEASNTPGGQWVYRPDAPGGVLPSTTSVASKLYMSPSDFPLPDHLPEFPSSEEIYQHFLAYMDHFELHDHVHLNTCVVSVMKTVGSGVWEVRATYKPPGQVDDQLGEARTFTGKKLIVATGANLTPKYPQETMYSKFTGTTSHIANFKGDKSPFVGKRVLFIGGSDSACDMAHSLKDCASCVAVSLRKGAWFQGRDFGEVYPAQKALPSDQLYNRWAHNLIGVRRIAPFVQQMVEKRWGASGSGIDEWKSEADYVGTYYIKSRQLIYDVRAEKVLPRRGVQDIESNKVWFQGKAEPEEYDHIVFATGYSAKVNFEAPFDQTNDRYNLILDVDDPSLGWLGTCRPYLTSFVMIIEMQALWIANAFANEIAIPNQQQRKAAAVAELACLSQRFPHWNYNKHMYLIDPYRYMDILAGDMGMRPNLIKLFFTNPKYWVSSVLGTWSHFHYYTLDKKAEKRSVALTEMKKLDDHPMSRTVREDTWILVFWKLPLSLASSIFGSKSAITKRVRKFVASMVRSKTTSLTLDRITSKDARVCLASQITLVDGVLSTTKLAWLDALRTKVGSQHDLNELIAFSRITDSAALVDKLVCAASSDEEDNRRQEAMLDLQSYKTLRLGRSNADGGESEGVLDEREITELGRLSSLLSSSTTAAAEPPQEGNTLQRRSSSSRGSSSKFQVDEVENPDAIVLLFGWFGANPKHLKKYSTKAYNNTVTSIVVVADCLDVVVRNEKNLRQLTYMAIQEASKHLKNHPHVPLVVHCFSTGGALLVEQFDQILAGTTPNDSNAASSDDEDTVLLSLIKDRFNLQIFDSGPVFPRLRNAIRGIQEGVPNPLIQFPLVAACWSIVQLNKVVEVIAGKPPAADLFWNRMKTSCCGRAQVAYIYSLEDSVCDATDMKDLISFRQRQAGSSSSSSSSSTGATTKIHTLEFETGRHCNLLRDHPDEYCRFVQGLVEDINNNKPAPAPTPDVAATPVMTTLLQKQQSKKLHLEKSSSYYHHQKNAAAIPYNTLAAGPLYVRPQRISNAAA